MSLKQDIKEVKNELGTQEQFIESLLKSERFFRKYQKLIFTLIVILLIAFIGNYFNGVFKAKEVAKQNVEYEKLINNLKDEKALKYLEKNNINLYALALLKDAKKDNDNKILIGAVNDKNLNPLLKDLINYQLGKNSAPLMSEYANLIKGYEFLQKNDIANAFDEFAKIPPTSPLKQFVDALKHYHGNKK